MSKSLIRTLGFVLFAVFLTVCGGPLAQAQGAAINGIVTDASKAVVPNVKVELLETATQSRQEVVTNQSGFYSISNIMPGAIRGDGDGHRLSNSGA